MSNRMTFADGVSAENLQNDLATQFLGGLVGRIDSVHISLTDKGRSKASITGEFIGTTFDKVKTPKIEKGVLFNPSLLEKLRIFFTTNDCPAHVSEKGEVSKTAPATATSSDTVLSKEELQKEIDSKIKALQKSIAVEEDDSKIAKLNAEIASLRDRKKTLKNA